ncbi:MAG: hypothetical protein GX413_01425 [Acetobacter sp.]|nr:hypothetical protein [Acetobacter sp.]
MTPTEKIRSNPYSPWCQHQSMIQERKARRLASIADHKCMEVFCRHDDCDRKLSRSGVFWGHDGSGPVSH